MLSGSFCKVQKGGVGKENKRIKKCVHKREPIIMMKRSGKYQTLGVQVTGFFLLSAL